MEYIGRRRKKKRSKKIFCCRLRSDGDQKSSIENENLLDLHGYLANMVEWLKLVGYYIYHFD
jgi:hypothetical protein